MGSTARTIGGLDGTAHCQYPRSCYIPAVCCMHKLPTIGNNFMHVCGMQDLVDPIYYNNILCVVLSISFVCFLFMIQVLHGASVCASASGHGAFR